jgi:hypothetical protein
LFDVANVAHIFEAVNARAIDDVGALQLSEVIQELIPTHLNAVYMSSTEKC